jgi:ferredoxin
VIETGEPIIQGRVYAETAAHPGLKKHYLHNYHPVRDEGGTIIGLSCAVQDVDDLQRSEQDRSELEQRLRQSQKLEAVGELENIQPVTVTFARSDTQGTWDPSKGTLLDLAESVGLRPAYSCRSGICGTCETRVESGEGAYTDPPLAEPEPGSALICCAYPCTAGQELVLDL